MYMSSLYICVPHGVQDAHKGQKMVLEPLELELRLIVNHLVGSGNNPSPARTTHALNHETIISSPYPTYLFFKS